MSNPVVVARGLGRRFADRVVLADIDLDVSPGEVVGLVGPNGGGKSTLLRLMAGLLRPSTGSVSVSDVPAHVVALRQSGAIGLITAEAGLYPLLTGRENLHFFGGLYGVGPREIDERVGELAERLGLSRLDEPVGTYSSGMTQKVSLARALLLRPQLLLLDEPTSHLDPLATHHLHTAVRQQADEGVAVVMVTHDLHAAEQVCNRVVAVHRGLRGTAEFDRPTLPTPSRLHALFEAASLPVGEP